MYTFVNGKFVKDDELGAQGIKNPVPRRRPGQQPTDETQGDDKSSGGN